MFLIQIQAENSNTLQNHENNIIVKQGIFTFIIDSSVNLKKFTRKISLRKISRISQFNKMPISTDLNKEHKDLVVKFYVIFRRVQDLLNMHSKKLKMINIRIYRNLKKNILKLKRVSHHRAAAFYDPKTSTIYISAKKCNEYILAHEMAHAIISKFFLIAPPANTQEILAIYCDSHLKDNSDYINVR